MPPLDLNTIWFLILGLLLTGYAVLDGFDLGVGALHLFARKDEERRIFLNAIGPVWDGNEVWLVTSAGALLAGFPNVYAAVFTGFYPLIMLMLAGLILRAVAIEFRSKEKWGWWRTVWDVTFTLGSVMSTLVFGLAIGNLVIGVPLTNQMEFSAGNPLGLLQPYPLLVAALLLTLFMLHGAIFLQLKTEDALQKALRVWILQIFGFFLVLYMLTTIATLVWFPRMVHNFEVYPASWGLLILTLLAVANIPRAIYLGREFEALLTSSGVIAGTFGLFGIGLYPVLLPSIFSPASSLDIYNAAASQFTLGVLLTVAVIGMPFVLAYTVSVYWIFRGKVKIDKFSY